MRQARLYKVEIACIVKCSLSMREDKNLNNGYGFIEFKSKEECAKAIQYCKREAFCGGRLTATMVKDAMKRDEEAENGATTDDSKPIYLKEFTDEELHSKLQKLGEVAKRNPVQAQRLLQQNQSFLYALLEAEHKLGMLTTAVPGMDYLLGTE